MKRLATFKLLAIVMMVFVFAGITQAQFITTLSGTVTDADDGTPVANYKMLVTFKDDTIGFKLPVFTDENGAYALQVLVGHTYTISSLDSFLYEPFSADVEVSTADPVTYDIQLHKRTDLQPVTGNVSFKGKGVATTVYFLKISDDIDINDFREYETHFTLPYLAVQWASYSAQSDENGDFSLEMMNGNYVVYVAATDTTLTHWGVFAVNGPTTMDPIILKEMKTLSGHVYNMDGYQNVTIMAYSLNKGRPYVAMPDSNGDYTMEVATGTYIVRLQAFFDDYMYHVFYDSVYMPQDADSVIVQDDVTGIDFNLPEPSVAPFTISGTVTSKQSGLPIENAHLAFVSYNFFTNLYQAYMADTDADGNYTIEGVTMLQEDSLVGFCYTDSLFFAQFYDGKATYLTADPIVYHANENVTGIDFALDSIITDSSYAISGYVQDEDGNPVQTGEVTAYTTATNVGVITTKIDSNGYYAFDPVFPTGSTVYLVAWGGFGYLPSIYDGAETWEDADAIIIEDHDVDNINFTLKKTAPARVPLAKIDGKVEVGALTKTGAASSFDGDIVYVRPAGTTEWTAYDYVDNDGTFELPVETNGTYEVKITTPDPNDDEEITTVEVTDLQGEVTLNPTSISDRGNDIVVKSAKLYNAYPNPFNPATTIRVDMAKTGQASLIVYNVIGQKVKTLFNGNLTKGSKKFVWNGTDDYGKQVASGLYFYQLKTGNTKITKAVMFLK